jgi:hypothetical protein
LLGVLEALTRGSTIPGVLGVVGHYHAGDGIGVAATYERGRQQGASWADVCASSFIHSLAESMGVVDNVLLIGQSAEGMSKLRRRPSEDERFTLKRVHFNFYHSSLSSLATPTVITSNGSIVSGAVKSTPAVHGNGDCSSGAAAAQLLNTSPFVTRRQVTPVTLPGGYS